MTRRFVYHPLALLALAWPLLATAENDWPAPIKALSDFAKSCNLPKIMDAQVAPERIC